MRTALLLVVGGVALAGVATACGGAAGRPPGAAPEYETPPGPRRDGGDGGSAPLSPVDAALAHSATAVDPH